MAEITEIKKICNRIEDLFWKLIEKIEMMIFGKF